MNSGTKILLALFLIASVSCNKELVYSYGCGDGVTKLSPIAKTAVAMAKHKNVKGLTRWLNSNKPVKLAFAVDGFYSLKENDSLFVKASQTLMRINQVKADTTRIECCSGCITSNYTLKSVLRGKKF
jgi:hypothetical protein